MVVAAAATAKGDRQMFESLADFVAFALDRAKQRSKRVQLILLACTAGL